MKRFLSHIVCTLLMATLIVSFGVSSFGATEEVITGNYDFIGDTAWSHDGKTIVFSADQDIFLMDMEQGTVVNLTDQVDTKCYHPVFSADGTEVLYTNYSLIKQGQNATTPGVWGTNTSAVNIETKKIRLLIDEASSLSLSRDGRYAIYGKNNTDLAIYDFQTGTETMLGMSDRTTAPYYCRQAAAISPDNKYIIARGKTIAGIPTYSQIDDVYKFYKINIKTGEAEQIGDREYQLPKFSPIDDNKIIVTTSVVLHELIPRYPLQYRDKGTGEIRVITGEDRFDPDKFILNSDTGKYESINYDNYYSVEADQDVYSFDKETEKYVVITDIDYYEGHWSKNRMVMDFTYNLVVYDLETDENYTILNSGYLQSKCGSWSPDGKQICYVLDDGEFHSLYIYDIEAGTHKTVILGTDDVDPVSVETETTPAPFAITGNYPNPFNPTTTIEFSLEKAGDVSLDIFNVMGQKVRSLESNVMAPGAHSVVWNGRDDSGNVVSSGIYISRLTMGESVQSKPMLLAK